MRSIFSLLLILNFFFVSSQTTVKSIVHDGLTRSYRLHLPPGYNSSLNYPLVFNLHGLGSNALQQEFYTQFNSVADTAGIIVVYPDGVSNQWNVTGSTGADDVGFISALIDTLSSQYSIDLNRVYSCGMSMGGYMSYRLACELNNRIAAIVSVTGLLATFPCNPGHPIGIMQVHGTDDPTVPYSGVSGTIQFWTSNNGCAGTPTVTHLPDINTGDSSTVTKTHYCNCNNSTEVILYTINGGEHTWPDAAINIAITNRDFNASRELWGFLKKYRLNNPPSPAPTCDTLATLIEMLADENKVSIYPNPLITKSTVEFGLGLNRLQVALVDANGRVVRDFGEVTKNRLSISRDQLPSGIYALILTTTSKVIPIKIIVAD